MLSGISKFLFGGSYEETNEETRAPEEKETLQINNEQKPSSCSVSQHKARSPEGDGNDETNSPLVRDSDSEGNVTGVPSKTKSSPRLKKSGTNFKTTPVEDQDWLLVDRLSPTPDPEGSSDVTQKFGFDSPFQMREEDTSCLGAMQLRHDSHFTHLAVSRHSHEEGGQFMGIPDYVAPEESWLVTPPSCFTAGGSSPERMQTSPLENLLIEHPSMSVYGPRGRQDSSGVHSEASEDEDENTHQQQPTTQSSSRLSHRSGRPTVAAVEQAVIQQQQMAAARSSQIIKQKNDSRKNTKSIIHRSNKTREVHSRGRRPYARDHLKQPSRKAGYRK